MLGAGRAGARAGRALHRFATRLVSTQQPRLAEAFNSRLGSGGVLGYLQWGARQRAGLFGIPELRTSSGFQELTQQCRVNVEALRAEVVSPVRRRNVAVIFDDMSDELCRVADMAEFVRLTHPEQEFQQAAGEACVAASAVVETLNTDQEIFRALELALARGDVKEETAEDRQVAELFTHDFLMSGVGLPAQQRRRAVELNDRILRLGHWFAGSAHQPVLVEQERLPGGARDLFWPRHEGKVVVTSQAMDQRSDLGRETAYRLYYRQDGEREAVLDALLQDRCELAQLCGYTSFSERGAEHTLAQSPGRVEQFLSSLAGQLRPRVVQEQREMLVSKRRNNPDSGPLAVWDVPYFTTQARQSFLSQDSKNIAEFFSLGVVMEGLDDLFSSLYGVRLERAEVEEGELWSGDVVKLAVLENTDDLLGHIYCDFFRRSGKNSSDCHFTIRGGRERSDGSYQLPVVAVVLNLAPPSRSRPTCLSPTTMDNLFHEMGHAMHSILGRTKYQHVTGTRCSTDFAEVPSTLMEYFASDLRVLSRVNRHYNTGARLPEASLRKLAASKKVYAGTELQAQMVFAAADQAFHGSAVPASLAGEMERLQGELCCLPAVPRTAPHLRHRQVNLFGHLVGYGARYYSYLLARAVACSIWQHSFQADPYSGAAGGRYRSACLAPGGGTPSHNLVSSFLQQTLDPAQLASSLVAELDTKTKEVEEALRGQ